jgi:arsenite-transporting ATPase
MAGHHTLVVSTDPAHSLGDSLAQSVGGGKPVAVEGTDGMLYAMEIDPEQSKAEFAAFAAADQGKGVKDFMGSMGLGGVIEQLEELKLGELLDTPPPGLDEAIAITKVVQFIKAEEYAKFTRIIFDTAPTGHTLRLLSLPDFLDATIGKVVRLRQKIAGAANSVKSLFGQGDGGARGRGAGWARRGQCLRAQRAMRSRMRTAAPSPDALRASRRFLSLPQARMRRLPSWRRSRRGCWR